MAYRPLMCWSTGREPIRRSRRADTAPRQTRQPAAPAPGWRRAFLTRSYGARGERGGVDASHAVASRFRVRTPMLPAGRHGAYVVAGAGTLTSRTGSGVSSRGSGRSRWGAAFLRLTDGDLAGNIKRRAAKACRIQKLVHARLHLAGRSSALRPSHWRGEGLIDRAWISLPGGGPGWRTPPGAARPSSSALERGTDHDAADMARPSLATR